MKCSITTEDLQSFVDGELAPGAHREVAQHLAECEACRDQAAALRDLARRIGALQLASAPSDLVHEAMARIAPVARRGREQYKGGPGLTWRHLWAYVGAVAAVLVALTFAVDRFEAKETGRSMVATLATEARKERDTKAVVDALVQAFDTKKPMATVRRPGFTAVVYDARVAKDGDVYMLTNFTFAGGSCPDIRDQYGNLYVPISAGTWEGPNELVWLTPLRPSDVRGRPAELTLSFAGRDIAALRGRTGLAPMVFSAVTITVKDPKRGLDPGAMLARMMANADLDAETQRDLARQLRILAPNGADALSDSF